MEDIYIPKELGFIPTEEQLEIVKQSINRQCLKIDALAGSSKTSTLVLVANNLPVRSLYLAFNKTMCEEAKGKFPPHVKVRTSHSLAYREVGCEYQHKLTRPYGEYKNVLGTGSEIARAFRLAPFKVNKDKVITSAAMGHAIKSTVNNFEYSADRNISEKHVSLVEVKPYLHLKEFKLSEYRSKILKFAKKLWDKRKDICDDTLITHDTYMKIFQLSNPLLSDYEVIYLDEGQDSSMCVLDLFSRQTCKKIIVGDNLQSIYQFRKAINALQKLDWSECKLTKSFRFGQDVADIANGIALNEDMRVFINMKGYERKHTEVVESLPSNIKDGVCYIYRTNAALLEKSLELLEEGKKIAIHVDITDFVSKVNSVVALMTGDKKNVKHADILIYNSWEDLKEDASFQKGELQRIVKIVASGEHTRVLRLLKEYKPVKNPDVMLITAHKSKGLEFNTVVIGDDFEPLCENEQTGKVEYVSDAERNLLYVACTRAIELLVINNTIKQILNINGLWCEEEPEDVYNEGIEVNINEIVHIHPSRMEEGLSYLHDKLSNTEHAWEAQDQMDEHGFDNEEYDNAYNVDDSLRLMPSV